MLRPQFSDQSIDPACFSRDHLLHHSRDLPQLSSHSIHFGQPASTKFHSIFATASPHLIAATARHCLTHGIFTMGVVSSLRVLPISGRSRVLLSGSSSCSASSSSFCSSSLSTHFSHLGGSSRATDPSLCFPQHLSQPYIACRHLAP